ncbi:MAG: FdhC protein, partial [Caldiserica bacterium CG17_big_fil_post_rev_8_21_14_2_50_35_7]
MNELNLFPPPQIAEKMRDVGIGKCKIPMKKFFVLAILAGAFIAFGAQLSILVGSDVTLGFGFTKFIAASVFTVGLMLVVVAGAELFTGDNLIVISALEKKVKWGELLKAWIAVYIGNFIGSILIALFLFWGGLWGLNGNAVGASALKIASSKVSLTFVQGLFRGILCNWLVCLAVWMATSSKDVIGKLFAIYFPIMAFVASGFEHSVANMFFIPYGILLKTVPKVVEATGKTLQDFAGLNWGT